MFHEVWELERFHTAKVTTKVNTRALAMVPFNKPHMIALVFHSNHCNYVSIFHHWRDGQNLK